MIDADGDCRAGRHRLEALPNCPHQFGQHSVREELLELFFEHIFQIEFFRECRAVPRVLFMHNGIIIV